MSFVHSVFTALPPYRYATSASPVSAPGIRFSIATRVYKNACCQDFWTWHARKINFLAFLGAPKIIFSEKCANILFKKEIRAR